MLEKIRKMINGGMFKNIKRNFELFCLVVIIGIWGINFFVAKKGSKVHKGENEVRKKGITHVEIKDEETKNEEVEKENVEEETEGIDYVDKKYVHIDGAVKTSGVIEIEDGMRLKDVIKKAGGLTKDADTSSINLAGFIDDGEKIYIPSKKEVQEFRKNDNNTSSNVNSKNNKKNSIATNEVVKRSGKVNINRAGRAELTTLTGVGDKTADMIIKYRKEKGKFKSISDIKNIKGIGDAKYDKMKNHITV